MDKIFKSEKKDFSYSRNVIESNRGKNNFEETTKFRAIKHLNMPNPSQIAGKNLRKNSNYSEGLSTSSEDNLEQKKDKKINEKKEPYKSKKIDFKRKYKTELCKYFEIDGFCKYGEKCAYAHGKENLRLKVTNTSSYRTKKCSQFFEKGYCPYGNRCQFAHQLESNIINNPLDKKMSYMKILESFSKIEKIKNIQNIVEKPRLQVFIDIVSSEKPSRLFNDIKSLGFNGVIYY